jgi:hypothetical protein
MDVLSYTFGKKYTDQQVGKMLDGSFDTEVLQTKIDEKLGALEAQYAPDLAGVKTSLADLASKPYFLSERAKVKDSVSINIHGRGTDTPSNLSLVQELGVKNIRMDLKWANIETTKGTYNFSSYDTTVNDYVNNGIKPLVILDYANSLYTSAEMVNAYIAFVSAASLHYASSTLVYEIYNEPNNTTFWFDNTMTDTQKIDNYFNMLKGAYSAIKQNSPKSLVFAPALSANFGYGGDWENFYKWTYWLKELFKKGALEYMDAVSIHPYRINNTPETILETTYARVRTLIGRYATKYTPIVATEIGWSNAVYSNGVANPDPAFPRNISEAQQGQYAVRSILLNLMAGIPYTTIYELVNPGTDTTLVEQNFGLVKMDGTKKVGFTYVQSILSSLADYRYTNRISAPDDVYALQFADDSGNVKVASWTVSGATKTVTIEGVSQSLNGVPTVFSISGKYTPNVYRADAKSNPSLVLNSAYNLDANNLIEKGEYACNSTTLNVPTTSFAVLEVTGANVENPTLTQIYRAPTTGWIYTRTCKNDGTWNAWVRQLTSSDIFESALTDMTINAGITKNRPATYKRSVSNTREIITITLDVTFAAGSTASIGSIPVAYAPVFTLQFSVRGAGGVQAFLAVNTDGTITANGMPGTCTGLSGQISYDRTAMKLT